MKTLYIKDAEDLIKIRDFVESEEDSNYIFELMNDIDLKSIDWIPIGCTKTNERTFAFKGILQGNNHVIKNLVATIDGASFIYCNNGVIQNLYMDNTCKFQTTNNLTLIGSICSVNCGIIKGCKSSAIVKGKHFIGGICGMSTTDMLFKEEKEKVVIENCAFYGSVEGESYVGGICGYLECEAKDLINRGVVKGKKHVGGITGDISDGDYQNFTNEGPVFGFEKVDLICPEKEAINIENKIANGRIISKEDSILKTVLG
jgi:hypothetical protein